MIYDDAFIGTAANRITFNDYATTPIYRVISRVPQQRDLRELNFPIPFESGISDFETLIGRSIYVIDGTMYPGGIAEYDSGIRALRKLASLEISQDDINSDIGYVQYVWTDDDIQRCLFVKVLYVQIIEDTRKGLVQPFRLICKVKDPTIYSYTQHLATTQTVDPTLVGGSAIYPFSYPIIYGASTYSVSSNAINAGDLPVYPIAINVYGPINSPTVTNSSTGEYIQITTNIADGSVLRMAYDKDSVTVEVDGVSVMNQTSGTFFKLQSGNNEIQLTGSTIGSGAYVEVSYRDGWPLS
jgi:hypothetical protein